jgi:hypothetical protein
MSTGVMDEQTIILAANEETMQEVEVSLTVRTSLNKEGSSLTLFVSNIKGRRYCLERISREFLRQFWTI